MSHAKYHDYVVIGAGPAGLQLAYYLQRAGRDFAVLEAGPQAGHFFTQYPRHRKLISVNKVYTGSQDAEMNLRWDWNSLLNDEAPEPLLFKDFSKDYFPHADTMPAYLNAFRARYALPVMFDSAVQRVEWHGEHYHVFTSQGELRCRVLVVATGVPRTYLPALPGIELAEPYSAVSVDAQQFCDQRVLIVGKGNSAFETADHLVGTAAMIHVASPNPLRMAWATHFVGDLRAVNNNLLDTYQLKSQNAVIDARILGIERDGQRYAVTFEYAHAQGEIERIVYDRVIACTGFAFDPAPYAQCLPQTCINGRFPSQSAEWESVNQRNMFFAGTLMQMRDFKKQMSGFVHGFRYNVRTLHRLLEERFHDQPYPSQPVECSARGLAQAILARVNRSSALWQQPAFLCDAIVLERSAGVARQFPELSFDLAALRHAQDEYLTVSLEYGSRKFADPFGVARIARDNSAQAQDSNFLHPVIRHYLAGALHSEHHIVEDLAAEWVEPEHTEPLQRYLDALFEPAPGALGQAAASDLVEAAK